MSEKILAIERVQVRGADDWYDGFVVITTEQKISLLIEAGQECCEDWGYFLSEDEVSRFIGADLLGVSITDTALVTQGLPMELDFDRRLQTLFVNLDTSDGRLQFVAYNAHNGYYGHNAVVRARQLQHEVEL